MSTELIQRARAFAQQAHERVGQRRKYTGEPYWHHPVAVAALVADAGGDEAMVAAALLHDTVEDTDVTLADIRAAFGDDVAALVDDLTDVSQPHHGNRAQRKALDRAHTAAASNRAKTIKLADLIDNTASIVAHDPHFARVYLREKAQLLAVLKGGDETLLARAWALVEHGRRQLGLTRAEPA